MQDDTRRRPSEPRTGEDSRQLEAFLEELTISVKQFGVTKVTQHLRNKRYNLINIKDENFSKVLNAVSETYELEPAEIINGNGRKNGRKQALGMLIYFLYYNFDYSMNKIGVLVNKNAGNCSTYRKEIEQLDNRLKSHRQDIKFKEVIKGKLQPSQHE